MRKIGYARISTDDQSLSGQIAALQDAGCDLIFTENASGAKRRRPELAKMLCAIQPGDTLVVTRIDRLARSLSHLLEIIDQLEKRKIGFRSLGDPIDTTKPHGRFALQMLGAVAEFERVLICERSVAGLRAAMAKGAKPGNPGLRNKDPEMLKKARDGREAARNEPILMHASQYLPTIATLRPATPWDSVVEILNRDGIKHPISDQKWTPNSLIRVARRLVDAGMADASILDAAPKRVSSDNLARMIVGLANLKPGITLDGIAKHLEAMGQPTPRGGKRWSRSSVKHLLDKAKAQGLTPPQE